MQVFKTFTAVLIQAYPFSTGLPTKYEASETTVQN